MIQCANKKKNESACNCTYPGCPRHAVCCECLAYHRAREEMPACYFDRKKEASYDRSVEYYMSGRK